MGMRVRFCYVGHGAMNYIQIYDNSNQNQVLGHVLVDAGSTDDKTDHTFLNQNLNYIKQEIAQHTAPVYVFITHFHADHYNLLNKLKIPKDSEGGMYIGSMQYMDDLIGEGPENKLYQFWLLHESMEREILYQTLIPVKMMEIGDVKIYCLWNNYCTNITGAAIKNTFFSASFGKLCRNRNGAAFAFCCGDNAVIFPGDMTGANFMALFLQDDLYMHMKLLLNSYKIWMTVPHHGSSHTLALEPFFDPLVCIDLKTLSYDFDRLLWVMTDVFQGPIRMYISAGCRDKFFHPDYTAAIAYDRCGNISSCLETHFEAYKAIYDIDEKYKYGVSYESLSNREKNTWMNVYINNGSTLSLAASQNGYETLNLP